MANDIAIVGSGGFGREVLWLIEEINRSLSTEAKWNPVGFLDDNKDLWGAKVDDKSVLGGLDWLHGRAISAAIAVGSPTSRESLVARIPKTIKFPPLIHPTVLRSRRVLFEDGVIVQPGTILTTNVCVKKFSIINLCCTVGHDAVLGEFCTLSPGVNISGFVTLGARVFVGTGAQILEGLTVKSQAIIGAGSVVNRDVDAEQTVVGVPARPIHKRPLQK